MSELKNIGELRAHVQSVLLNEIGLDAREARREADLIMVHVTHSALSRLLAFPETAVTEQERLSAEQILSERRSRRPLQYCLGYTEFMGLRFSVREGVLIPRADTEALVETTLQLLSDLRHPRVLEVGCGSGAVVASLLKIRADISAVAIDVSPVALQVTEENARANGVLDRLKLEQVSWFDYSQAPPSSLFAAIVSNPPYIPQAQMTELEPEVGVFEPKEALVGMDADGLGFYRSFSERAWSLLSDSGCIAVEVGDGQAEAVAGMFQKPHWTRVATHNDLAGTARVVSVLKSNSGI